MSYITDCGSDFSIADGHVNFTGLATTYGERIPVSCNEGYELVGEEVITCLADGTWSKDVICRIKGKYWNFNKNLTLYLLHDLLFMASEFFTYKKIPMYCKV